MGQLRQLVEHGDVRQRVRPAQHEHLRLGGQPHPLRPQQHLLRRGQAHRPRQGILGVSAPFYCFFTLFFFRLIPIDGPAMASMQTPRVDDLRRPRVPRRTALGVGRSAGLRVAPGLLLHLARHQVHRQGRSITTTPSIRKDHRLD